MLQPILKEEFAISVSREPFLAHQVLFLDGLTGSGKTMMGPILSSLARMEVQRMDHIHEHLCGVHFLGGISEDAAVALIRMYTDLALYNVMIGRESNFRWKDLSGVLNNPRGLRYLWRLFEPDGDPVEGRIQKIQPILQIHAHQVLGIASPIFSALGDRLVLVEMIRYPLYLLEHWDSYIGRHGTDPRDFTVWFDHKGKALPWFTRGWEEKYLAGNRMDRVIYAIDWITRRAEETLGSLDPAARRRVVVIPFERFVVAPWSYLQQVAGLLGTSVTPATRRVLKKQRVPRQLSVDGLDLDIYRRYRWIPPKKGTSEGLEMRRRWDETRQKASKEGMQVLERICAEYETRYWKP